MSRVQGVTAELRTVHQVPPSSAVSLSHLQLVETLLPLLDKGNRVIREEYRRLLRSAVQLTSPPPKVAPLSRLQSSAISISRISPSVVLTARPPPSGSVTPGAGALRASSPLVSSGRESQESPSASMRRLRVTHESTEDLHREAGSASELEEERMVTSGSEFDIPLSDGNSSQVFQIPVVPAVAAGTVILPTLRRKVSSQQAPEVAAPPAPQVPAVPVVAAPPSARRVRGRAQIDLSEAGDVLADPPASARGTRRGWASTRATRIRPPGCYKLPARDRGEVPPSWGVQHPPVAEKLMLTMPDNTLEPRRLQAKPSLAPIPKPNRWRDMVKALNMFCSLSSSCSGTTAVCRPSLTSSLGTVTSFGGTIGGGNFRLNLFL